MTAPLPHGAFYVVHYPVAGKVALWYGDPDGPSGALRCGLYACPAKDEDALYAWLGEADGLAAVRAAWGKVADFAREALARYEDFAHPPGQPSLAPAGPRTPADVLADPRPGDVVRSRQSPDALTVRFATADRVYVEYAAVNVGPHMPPVSPSDGPYFPRSKWAEVVAWVRL